MLGTAGASANSGAPALLILGDSVSAGYGMEMDQTWGALLQSRLDDEGYEYRVVNASISGDTSEGGAARIGAALDTFDPAVVVLELGGNDGLRGLPTARMKSNLKKIIDSSREAGADVVLLGIKIPPNYGQRYTQAFERVYHELADEFGLPWVEFFMDGVALDEELMQSDGIHPNVEAQSVLLDNAWPAIEAAIRNRAD